MRSLPRYIEPSNQSIQALGCPAGLLPLACQHAVPPPLLASWERDAVVQIHSKSSHPAPPPFDTPPLPPFPNQQPRAATAKPKHPRPASPIPSSRVTLPPTHRPGRGGGVCITTFEPGRRGRTVRGCMMKDRGSYAKRSALCDHQSHHARAPASTGLPPPRRRASRQHRRGAGARRGVPLAGSRHLLGCGMGGWTRKRLRRTGGRDGQTGHRWGTK